MIQFLRFVLVVGQDDVMISKSWNLLTFKRLTQYYISVLYFFWVSMFCRFCQESRWLVPLELLGYPMVKLGSAQKRLHWIIVNAGNSMSVWFSWSVKSCNIALLWHSKQSRHRVVLDPEGD